jgi:hypothetical protein
MMMGLMGLEILGETVVTILVSMRTTGLTKRMKHQSNTQRLLPMPNRVEKLVVVVETPCEVVLLMGQVARLDVMLYLAVEV